jgi:hypothetical protein
VLFDFSNSMSLVISLVILFWLGTITFLLWRLVKTFNRLTKGVSDEDFRSILGKLLDEIKDQQKKNEELDKRLSLLNLDCLNHIQKIGFIRYNPFSETGGNQSFALAILDGRDSGLVITSLHSRESTRVFAKPVKEGKEAGFEFSKEEIQAILAAKKLKK